MERLAKGIPNKVGLSYCKRCSRIKTPQGYLHVHNDSLAMAILHELKGVKCELKVLRYNDKTEVADVEFKTLVDDNKLFFEKQIQIKLEHKICIDDYRKSAGYYEAIVQLRGSRARIEKMLERLRLFIEERGAFITKVEDTENGLDVYTSNKLMTNNFIMFYKLKPKRSYTLYSIRDGKKVYRNTYLLRLE